MKRFQISILILCLVFSSLAVAKARHPFLKKRQKNKVSVEAQGVQLLKYIPQQEFEVLDVIRGHSVIENNKSDIENVLKVKAYELGGNAVIDIKCEKYGVGVSCYGTAIKLAKE